MASLISGYEYDIFISYRQKDNKHDCWVTEFVDNLKGELESTFKEEISVYFDINPHDGLLETHDVDASLKGKLKCLIFIPIISQTYCDSKSFAWQHEFCAFNRLAKEDQFGRDIRLSSGNVASRILPVKINELDPEDKTLLENELGGGLRGVEFIYKEAGVNRPLSPNDDAKENLNKTNYRNQINKVANAVKEIITAIKKHNQNVGEVPKEVVREKLEHLKKLNPKVIIASICVLALIALGYFFLPKVFKPSGQIEKSIAVMPFINDSPDTTNTYFINGLMDKITTDLQMVKELRVVSRTSVEKYRNNKTKSISEIAKELDVNYIVEGNGQKYGSSFSVDVKLIKAKGKETHLWSRPYEQEIKEVKDYIKVQSQIAQAIAEELKAVITPQEKQLIENTPTGNLTAYDFYQRGREEHTKYWIDNKNKAALQKAEGLYHKALKSDSTFAQAYTGLALVYWDKHYWKEYFSGNYMDSVLILSDIALSFDNKLDEAFTVKGNYYLIKGIRNKAFEYYDKALKINPNSWEAYLGKGYLYWIVDIVETINNYQKAASLYHGSELPNILKQIAEAYLSAGFIEKAKYYYQEAHALDGNEAEYFDGLAWAEFSLENFEEALKLVKKANEIDSTYLGDLLLPSTLSGHNDEAYINAKKLVEYYKKSGELNLQNSHRVGYAFWKAGKIKEAEYYFSQQIKYDEESIKLGRDIAQWKPAQYDLSATYAFLGDKVKAYQYLDEFNAMNFYPLWWLILLKHDPLFTNIHNEERFQNILKNMESKYQAGHERVRKWLEEQGIL